MHTPRTICWNNILEHSVNTMHQPTCSRIHQLYHQLFCIAQSPLNFIPPVHQKRTLSVHWIKFKPLTPTIVSWCITATLQILKSKICRHHSALQTLEAVCTLCILCRYHSQRDHSITVRRLGSRVVSLLDSGAEGPGFKSQSQRYYYLLLFVLSKQLTPILSLFTNQQNW